MGSQEDVDRTVAAGWVDLDLGELVRLARTVGGALGARHSQGRVAAELELSQATVGAIERGDRLPGLDTLAKMAKLLEPDPEARIELLTRWLAKWVEGKVRGEGLTEQPLLAEAARGLVRALSASHRRLPPEYPRTLQGFPEQFEPLIGVFPDRREVPPDSPADLFIRSGSVTDFQYFPLLRGMTEPMAICSDKFVLVMSKDWLRERFSGHNLLVVGSSGVNWLTRQLAGSALFRPLIDRAWRVWDSGYRERKELDDNRLLTPFWRLVDHAQHAGTGEVDPAAIPSSVLGPDQQARLPQAAELAREILKGETESSIVQHFRVPGFADPADGALHGQLPGYNTDFGVISLAPNPFDDSGRYLSIIVAGISGPGTAHALKTLFTRPDEFEMHPFGGVLRVEMPARDDWPGRFEKAVPRWDSKGYKPKDVLDNLAAALRTRPEDRRPAFQSWSEAELEAALTFVGRLLQRPA
jgi:DNA-binding XRE family transcriptional regulator